MGPQVKTRMGDRSRGEAGVQAMQETVWGEAFQDVAGGEETKYEAVRSGMCVS